MTSLVKDNLLGTYWGFTFPAGLAFQFVFEAEHVMQVKPHSSGVTSFPPKGDGRFSSAMFIQPYHSVYLGVHRSVTWKGLPG